MGAAARAALCATPIASAACLAAPTASAAAGITIDGLSAGGHPYGPLSAWGTATCSTTSGTAVVRVSAFQALMHPAGDGGSVTVTCAAQPVQWFLTTSPSINCFQPFVDSRCFMAGSMATAHAEVVEGGVVQASAFGSFPT